MTTRRYPRTLDEAFHRGGDWADPAVMRAVLNGSTWHTTGRVRQFLATYRLYRKHHSILYAARIACGCARGLPF